MQLINLQKSVASFGNADIDFFMKQLENITTKSEIELVFSGTISNGKSTLINALLGVDLLPMKLGATTSLITTIQQGRDRIVAMMKDGTTEERSLEKSSIEIFSQNREVERIAIYMEAFEYSGIRFVDTPGIDDISESREAHTYNYVPLADAVVFVVEASKGLTAQEKAFFESKIVKANKDKIFIVLNKIDNVMDEEIDTKKLLSPSIVQEYNIYQISALQYLVGRVKDDAERRERSRAEALKNDLDSYLKALDKNKVLKKRIDQSLDRVLELASIQIDTLVENASKARPEIEASLLEVHHKIDEASQKQKVLEEEMSLAIDALQECVHQHLSALKREINFTIKDVNHKEFMIDKFNDEVPLLCSKMMESLRQCSDKKLEGLNLEFEELDELYLWALRNIDDLMANVIWLLTFIPKIGKAITPLVPTIQKGVRQLVDMFGGQIIQSAVEEKVEGLLKEIEANINLSIEAYKTKLLSEYEHNELGAIRSERISLELLQKIAEEKQESIAHQVDYFKNSKSVVTAEVHALLEENRASL